MTDETQRLLLKQIQTLTCKIGGMEEDFSRKLAFINTEHVKELEDLQSVHMIRLELITKERDNLMMQVYSLTESVEELEAKLDSVTHTAQMASTLADSLETLRRDSKCDFDSLVSKAEMEREARVSEIMKREQVEKQLTDRVADLTIDNDNLHRFIETLRKDNDSLRQQIEKKVELTEAPNHAKIQKKEFRVGHPRCESFSELLETDLSLVDLHADI
ncbi:hypothetical protein BC830DRAFT_1130437 [Chytriomyces sp. MP71]|nr:hypothetical protein BC830DRAFT_1130437 [Chytriomyces sp. MP71]